MLCPKSPKCHTFQAFPRSSYQTTKTLEQSLLRYPICAIPILKIITTWQIFLDPLKSHHFHFFDLETSTVPKLLQTVKPTHQTYFKMTLEHAWTFILSPFQSLAKITHELPHISLMHQTWTFKTWFCDIDCPASKIQFYQALNITYDLIKPIQTHPNQLALKSLHHATLP